ncbi:MAG: DUF1838 domain-containing protein [Rhodospirillaceae bacterium]|nr:DUF1838 domain-containing protein [Rhodospirillaceae bacterium]
MDFSRRHLIAASSAWLAVSALHPAAAAAKAADPSQLLQTYARMRGAKNSGLALWWYTGTVWGKPVNDIARPMFLVQGLTYNRAILKPDGGIEQKLTGRGWYADPATGKPLETWTNPFTAEKITPPHIKSLQTQNIGADGALAAREATQFDAFSGGIGGLTVNGDTIWLTENFVAKTKPDATRGGAVNTTSSLSTFTSKLADVDNDGADFVPSYLNYQSLGSWPAWMKMDGAEQARGGSLSWQTRGHKVRGPQDGPADLRAWVEARHPGFLADPGI